MCSGLGKFFALAAAVPSAAGLSDPVGSCGLVEKLLSQSGRCLCLHRQPLTSAAAKRSFMCCGLGLPADTPSPFFLFVSLFIQPNSSCKFLYCILMAAVIL